MSCLVFSGYLLNLTCAYPYHLEFVASNYFRYGWVQSNVFMNEVVEHGFPNLSIANYGVGIGEYELGRGLGF